MLTLFTTLALNAPLTMLRSYPLLQAKRAVQCAGEEGVLEYKGEAQRLETDDGPVDMIHPLPEAAAGPMSVGPDGSTASIAQLLQEVGTLASSHVALSEGLEADLARESECRNGAVDAVAAQAALSWPAPWVSMVWCI